MSYYIFDSALVYDGEEAILAKIVEKPDFDYLLAWSSPDKGALQPAWSREKPPFIFQVNEEVENHPENYKNWGSLSLYSARLIDLIANAGGRFETFDATLLDRKSSEELPLDYKVFRLMEMLDGIDPERSDIREVNEQRYYQTLVLKEEVLNANPIIFRDRNFSSLVLVHETLKKRLEDENITGCRFAPLYNYKSANWSDRFDEQGNDRRSFQGLPSEEVYRAWLAKRQNNQKSQSKQAGEQNNKNIPDERSLSDQELKDLQADINDAWQYLSIPQSSAPQEIVKAIKAAVREMCEQRLAEEDKKWAALRLGCLWGEQVCRVYGWHWAELTFKDEGKYQRTAIVSPDRACCVLPMNFVWKHLEKPEHEETIALLFNMLSRDEVRQTKRYQVLAW